jgi:hypothetical protein
MRAKSDGAHGVGTEKGTLPGGRGGGGGGEKFEVFGSGI